MMNLLRALGALVLVASATVAVAQSPRLAPERHGAISAPRVSLDAAGAPAIDNTLRVSPPAGAAFRVSGTGTEFSVCPQTGCDLTRDILLAQLYARGQSKWDVTHAETLVSFDNSINTGYVPTWATSTAYSVGTIVSNSNKLFKVRLAGTSAGTGSGPTVVDPLNRGIDVTDGTITWTYISGQDDTDNKTTFSITTTIGPNAGRSWGWATNTIILPGFKNKTAFASEEDFHNQGAACDTIGANCFLKNMFIGGNTITSVLQVSPGGDIVPISSDASSGGGAKYGINFDGANTLREVTFSDGTSASITLKGWAGTTHRGGFIVDQSTSPATVTAAGTNSSAAYDDQSFSPYGMWARGNYGIAAYRYGDYMVGKWGGDATYKAVTLNGSFAVGAMSGMFGKAGDNGLYVAAPTFVETRASGVTALQVTASKVQSYVPTYHYAVGALPSSPVEGDCAWDSAVHKLKCYDGTVWNAAW